MNKREIMEHYAGIVKYSEEYLFEKKLDMIVLHEIFDYAKKINDASYLKVMRVIKKNAEYGFLLDSGNSDEFERFACVNEDYRDSASVMDLITEYLLYLDRKVRPKVKTEKFTITRIDVQALLNELEKRKFFDPKYKGSLLKWFNGEPPKEPIPMIGTVTRFVSIIADLMDAQPKHINNTKEFAYTYILNSFLFNGRKTKLSTVKQIMKPGLNKDRDGHKSKKIPDIQSFVINYPT